MKITWKLFISTLFMVLLALSLSGTIMLSLSFSKSLNTEVQNIQMDNQRMKLEVSALISNYNKSIYINEMDALSAVLDTPKENWGTEDKQ